MRELARAENCGLRELLRVSCADPASPDSNDLAFGVAPRINAAGRIDHPTVALSVFEAARDLALNASALLEDLWAQDDTLWLNTPSRRLQFDDMVAKRKAELLTPAATQPPFQETDFACYTEDEIRAFAFDVRQIFLTERARHLAICSRCQRRLEYWSGLVENFDRATPMPDGKADA